MARPCTFRGVNATVHAPGFTNPLVPTLKHDANRFLTRWQMSWPERLSALMFGRVWVDIEGVLNAPPLAVQVAENFTLTQPEQHNP